MMNTKTTITIVGAVVGGDPCYGTVKTLTVNYRSNGQSAAYTGTDSEIADLLEQE